MIKPSKYQKDIYDVFCETEKNINISAVAGSGKTTVLIQLLQFIPDDKHALFVAFKRDKIGKRRYERRDTGISRSQV